MAERAEQKMAALFEGLRRMERLGLLGRLEKAGGQLYRALAADEKNVRARGALLKAAADEERNGELLRQMSTPKQNCEQCGKPLSAASGTACSFQCTFCESCAGELRSVCPNCGGALEPRAEQQIRP